MLLKLIEQPAALAKEFCLVDGAARRNGKGQQDTAMVACTPELSTATHTPTPISA